MTQVSTTPDAILVGFFFQLKATNNSAKFWFEFKLDIPSECDTFPKLSMKSKSRILKEEEKIFCIFFHSSSDFFMMGCLNLLYLPQFQEWDSRSLEPCSFFIRQCRVATPKSSLRLNLFISFVSLSLKKITLFRCIGISSAYPGFQW